MNTVIYSTNLFWAFLSPIGSILYTGLFGVAALTAVIVQKKQGKGARIAMGVCSIILFIFSFANAVRTFASISSGPETVVVRMHDKTIGRSTSNNGDTSTDYILAATAGLVSYDFIVDPKAYDRAQINSCYQVTFYNYKSLTHSIPDTDMYHNIEVVTRVEAADPAACP